MENTDSSALPLPLFDAAHARRNDPETSKAAARSVVNLGRTRDAILTLLANHSKGLTDEQIWKEYWRQGGPSLASTSPSGLRSRRSELVRMGFVEACGTGKTVSGRPCNIWKIKDGAAYAAGA